MVYNFLFPPSLVPSQPEAHKGSISHGKGDESHVGLSDRMASKGLNYIFCMRAPPESPPGSKTQSHKFLQKCIAIHRSSQTMFSLDFFLIAKAYFQRFPTHTACFMPSRPVECIAVSARLHGETDERTNISEDGEER